ncbi:MAG: hypothetical protein VW080_05565 [Flavobacteriaceae bacterium]
MKRFTVLFFVLVSELSWAQKEPFARVQSFFEAFHQRDSIQLTHHFDPEAKLLFTSNDPQGRPKQKKLTVHEFIVRVSTRADQPIWEEKIGEPIITQHQNLATVWVPFEFYLDGNFSHSGHNLFQLFWNGSNWKIVFLSDTRESTK